ncbi:MAG TPA: hypothetical protein VL096_02735 [Pirellulaceae bacterium]|nr:hypothetical protein [Pirellulaceae bacterium]
MNRWLYGACLLGVLAGGAMHASSAVAQESADVAGVTSRTDAFFRNLESQARTTEEVFTAFLAEGRLRDRKEDIKKLVDSYGKLNSQYGATRNVEKISARAVGKDVLVLTYLAKTDSYPIAWYITFYRPPGSMEKKNGWVVIALRFDTKIEEVGK